MAGPPYAPTTAALGGVPTIKEDVPITAVFLLIYIIGAVSHMTIFQKNKKRGHKFILSGMMFGFCMSRTVTTVLRITWANYPHNVRLAMAAQIFVAAGVVLLYVINILFAQRCLRALHPNFGWSKGVSIAFKIIYVLIVLILVMNITAIIDQFYTTQERLKLIDRKLTLAGGTYYCVVSFLPIPIVGLALIAPRKAHVEKFGSGRWRTKVRILLAGTFFLCLGSCYRTGTNFLTPRPRADPGWYQSKACFYIFNFVMEVLVIYLYVLVRVDRRFHIPDGSHKAGDYSRGHNATTTGGEVSQDKEKQEGGMFRINTEEEVFDDHETKEIEEEKELDVARGENRV